VLSGMVRKRECDPKEEGRIRNTVTELFSIPEVVDWFTGSWEVMNEPVICVPGSGERRPDRFMSRGDEAVVVDYKTGAFEAKHKDQVNGYMQLIRQMDYPEVRGYLLYLDPPALIEVKGREDYVQPSLFGQEV
jgi:hypothetical protein